VVLPLFYGQLVRCPVLLARLFLQLMFCQAHHKNWKVKLRFVQVRTSPLVLDSRIHIVTISWWQCKDCSCLISCIFFRRLPHTQLHIYNLSHLIALCNSILRLQFPKWGHNLFNASDFFCIQFSLSYYFKIHRSSL
jgi:hypothetical protein